MLFTSCNKDEVITEEVGGQPIIELDSETGIYTVKVDHELTIAPTYQNVEDALFAWTIDGTLVSSGPSLQRTWNECGDFYVKLRVDNAEGYAEEELKVEVKELTPPVICKHSKKCTFYTLRFGCSFAAVNTIKPQLL